MKNNLIKIYSISMVIFLFLISSMTPLVIGKTDTETSGKELTEDLTFSFHDEPCQTVDGPMDSAWPMQSHDRRHPGRSQQSTADNPGIEKWRFKADGWIMGGPSIGSNGTIYFGTVRDSIYALYPNGTLKWKYETNGDITSTPAIDEDGTIYVGSWDDYLYAIYPNGTLKWKFNAGGNILDSLVIADDGAIYFGTTNHGIYALNPDGTEKWNYPTGDIFSTPAIGDDGTVYVGSNDGSFHALYPNGTLKWQVRTGNVIRGSPTIADDGTIYIEGGGKMFALYPNNGTKKWEVSVGMTNLGPSLGEDGTLYFGTSTYRFYAINPNGTIKWKYDPGEYSALWCSSAAISADGTIYFGTNVDYPSSDAGDIIALNPDGTERWRKRIANVCVESSPCIGEDGTVYIGSVNDDQGGGDSYGYLHAFGEGVPNHAPSAPIITGPSSGKAEEKYEYTFVSSDSDSEDIYYYVNWEGHTHSSGWYGPFESGYVLTLNHTFPEGTNTIEAKARDTFGEDSDLSILEVSMPKNKIINPFERFLENHLHIFPLLRQLMGL